LDTNQTGNQVLGNEKIYDIEIDRNTKFVEPKEEKMLNHKRHNSVRSTKEMDKINHRQNSQNEWSNTSSEKARSSKEKINSRNVRQDSPLLGTRSKRKSSNTSSSLPKNSYIDILNNNSIIPEKKIDKPMEYLFDEEWKKALKNIIHQYPIIESLYTCLFIYSIL